MAVKGCLTARNDCDPPFSTNMLAGHDMVDTVASVSSFETRVGLLDSMERRWRLSQLYPPAQLMDMVDEYLFHL